MYRERIILQAKYGTVGQMVDLLKKVNEISIRQGAPKGRILQGVSGRQGTVVFERDFESFDQFFVTHKKLTASDEFRQWFPDFQSKMDHGVQEYYTVVE